MEIGRDRMGAGELVGGAISAWFGRFLEVFIVAVVFTVPIYILNGVLVAGLTDEVIDGELNVDTSALSGTLLASLVSVLLSGLLTAALVYVFLRIYREESFTVGGVFEFVAAKIWPIFVFTLLSAILIVIGFVALILPGIAFIIAFSLGTPALLDEELSGTQAIGRSFRLISGNWGIALAVVLIGLIINILVSLVVGGLAVAGSGGFVTPDFNNFSIGEAVLGVAFSAFLAPFIPALATALYFEVKGRDEGFPSLGHETGLGDGTPG